MEKQLKTNPGDRVPSCSLVPRQRHVAGGTQQEEHNQGCCVARPGSPPAESRLPQACATCARHDPPRTVQDDQWPTPPGTSSSYPDCSNLVHVNGRARLDLAPMEVQVAFCDRHMSVCLCDICGEGESLLTCLRSRGPLQSGLAPGP